MSDHTVTGLWRYPVKSMAGEPLARASIGPDGVLGDRGWALRDEVRGRICEARKLPAMLSLRARYTTADAGSAVEITLPDGSSVRSGDPDTHERLSKALGREVTLWPRRPAEDAEHYRRDLPDDLNQIGAYLLEFFAVDSPEELPDVTAFPEVVNRNQTIPGTYFDWGSIHLLSEASLAELGRLAPGSDVDVRRFRPNILIGGGTGYPETDWSGGQVRVGSAVLRVTDRTPRCVMITHPQGDLPKDRDLARVVHNQIEHCLGVYAEVERPGEVRVGDPVEFLRTE